MIDQLLHFDRTLFYIINSMWTHPALDLLMPWLRNKYFWTPLYLFLVVFFIVNFKKTGILTLIYLGLTVLFCDQLSSDIIKPLFERARPCNDIFWSEHMRVLVNCGTGFSFPSSHASNHFGVAFFLGAVFWRRSRIILPAALLWAFLVSYAQIYVGLHYPIDIFGGIAVGFFIGLALAFLFRRHVNDPL